MLSPDEHAAQAELWLECSHRHTDQGNEGDERIAAHSARQAIAHALLALRPVRPEPPLVDGLPALRGAVVRATIDGQRYLCCRLPEDSDDSYPWVCDSGMCFADDDLRDVDVLYPGAPS